jgi:diaminopimelate epimerase
MLLRFTKMHGLGNDFVVFDGVRQQIALRPDQYRFIADRHLGVGCDQILLVEPARDADTDFHYRIFNADGGEVEQCGNGARCFARFVRDQGLSDRDEIPVGTAAGPIRLRIEPDGQVRVNMGIPSLDPPRVPFVADAPASSYGIETGGEHYEIGVVSMGNPHAVLVVDDLAAAPVGTLGPQLEQHPRFPQRANIGFMVVQDRGHIALRVWERGVGETLACGSGACAAVVSGQLRGLLDDPVEVQVALGSLHIDWKGAGTPVWMTGPATRVFEGKIEL